MWRWKRPVAISMTISCWPTHTRLRNPLLYSRPNTVGHVLLACCKTRGRTRSRAHKLDEQVGVDLLVLHTASAYLIAPLPDSLCPKDYFAMATKTLPWLRFTRRATVSWLSALASASR